mmetsp:Transcript_80848/g.261806  ORF Transcript_80848/g.261806 Transcript_80848/m.261806 type:complete len:313 (-) Transcript_80848:88-1026(-)
MAAADDKPNEVAAKKENVKTVKAYNNVGYLTSPSSRHVRILCELQEPMKRMAEAGVDNYFQIVGTHLVMHPEERAQQIAELNQQVRKGGPRDELEALNAKLRFAKSLQPMDKFYVVAMELAESIARWSEDRGARGLPRYHVCTGGGPGIMEAANRGARAGGAATLGLGSSRPEWGGDLNKYVSDELAFQFHYFFMRKFWAAYKCMGFVVLPGGYGSLDELFEFLNLVVSKKISHSLPIILIGKEFWRKAVNFEYLVECSILSQTAVDIMVVVDTAEEAFSALTSKVQEAERTNENSVVENAKRRRLGPQTST